MMLWRVNIYGPMERVNGRLSKREILALKATINLDFHIGVMN
jgi:hypothetical protein